MTAERARTAEAFSQIADKLRRAARNQERVHLDYELVMAILTSPLYPQIAQLESEEIASSWQDSSDLGNSGSHGGQTGKSGPSAGMIAPLAPAAESQLASAVSTMAIRQRKRNKPLPITSPSTDGPSKSIPTPKPASAG